MTLSEQNLSNSTLNREGIRCIHGDILKPSSGHLSSNATQLCDHLLACGMLISSSFCLCVWFGRPRVTCKLRTCSSASGRVQRINSSACPYEEKLGKGKWFILFYLTVGRVQNGRWMSKNSEILWTLLWWAD